ncbi:TM2 domain-containing protein [uncultured Bartonella sp.]|uniref:TM2 domain-containing protein n=1 Tax=uncultured Bartonella sp. TaxID=104108 RepID=UPI0026270E0E|nr:TM2 domain-containing protein [uncultured Bartonella sp.]
MRGTILTFDRNFGFISGFDGNRYEFSRPDWRGKGQPSVGTEIDFVAEGKKARNVFPLNVASKHSKVVLAIVCWFFGVFGIHRFMVGKIGTGVLMLLLTLTVFGAFISLIWTIVDFVLILLGKFTDKDGNPVTSEYL